MSAAPKFTPVDAYGRPKASGEFYRRADVDAVAPELYALVAEGRCPDCGSLHDAVCPSDCEWCERRRAALAKVTQP